MTKRQEFRVIRSYGGFEVREYLPCSIAEVKVSADYASAGSVAFGSLFQYISKGNKSSEKIAMTAPVISAQKADKSDENEWFVSFVMPAGTTLVCLMRQESVALIRLLSQGCCSTTR
jgi:hypothetical protein